MAEGRLALIQAWAREAVARSRLLNEEARQRAQERLADPKIGALKQEAAVGEWENSGPW